MELKRWCVRLVPSSPALTAGRPSVTAAGKNSHLPATKHAWKTKKAAGKIPRRLFVWNNSPLVVTGHFRQVRHQRAAVTSCIGQLSDVSCTRGSSSCGTRASSCTRRSTTAGTSKCCSCRLLGSCTWECSYTSEHNCKLACSCRSERSWCCSTVRTRSLACSCRW